MKKLLIGAAAMLVCVGVFAQGKLGFQVNSDNLIYFTTDLAKLNPTDAAATANGTGTVFPIAGSGLYTGAGGTIAALAGSPTIIAGFFAGTSSSSLTLQTTTTIGDVGGEGSLVGVNMILPFAAGTPIWCQVQVYDSRATSAAGAWANQGWYAGESQIFQATPLASVYGPIYDRTATTVNSSWLPGTFAVADMVQYGPGYLGGIAVFATQGVIPEPGTFALAGLGLAALLVLRRRS